jgi:hypothetical protein
MKRLGNNRPRLKGRYSPYNNRIPGNLSVLEKKYWVEE